MEEKSRKGLLEKLSNLRDSLKAQLSEYNKLLKEHDEYLYEHSHLRLQGTSVDNLDHFGEYNEYEEDYRDGDDWNSSGCSW